MSEKPDMTDDWMNPEPRSETWGARTDDYPRYLIERRRVLSYFPFSKWDFWAKFDTREERDAELAKLQEEHPVWQLRSRDELFPPMAFNGATHDH